jgi:error-prone DNA polymerase
MPHGEVVADYQTLRLSLKGHPMQFLRDALRAERVITCKEAQTRPTGGVCAWRAWS